MLIIQKPLTKHFCPPLADVLAQLFVSVTAKGRRLPLADALCAASQRCSDDMMVRIAFGSEPSANRSWG